MSLPTLEEVLACPSLPTLPAIAIEVLERTRDETAGVDEIAAVVQNDPALSAKILKTVNSSYYALAEPCPTIARALAYMGLSTVKSLVLGFSLVAVGKTQPGGFSMTDYWSRCLHAAAAARRLAKRTGRCDPDESFAASLMQDLGMLAIQAALGDAYNEVIARTHGDHGRLCDVEKDMLGFDHTEVGGALAERWNLPPALVACIRHHHAADLSEQGAIVKIVALASQESTAMRLSNPTAAVNGLRGQAHEWFGVEASEVTELIRAVGSDVAELSALYEVETVGRDVNSILAEAEEASMAHQLTLERETETLRRSNDELARIAVTDGLTNVGNRKRFDQELLARFDQAASFRGSLGVVLCDVDHFKKFNDTYGHQAGDAVLIELASRLKKAVRGVDLVCRYGGEEFAAILPGAGLKDAAVIAERLRESVAAAPFDAGVDTPLTVTASFGTAVFDSDSAEVLRSPGLLVKAADRALYAAKDGGRNCVRVFRPEPRASSAA